MKLMKPKQPDRHTIVRGGDHAGLVDEALTRDVIGAFYKVYNTLGHGFLESVYSRALCIELRRRALRVTREVTVSNLTVGLLFHFGPRPTFCRLISEKKPRRDPAVSARSASSPFPRTGSAPS